MTYLEAQRKACEVSSRHPGEPVHVFACLAVPADGSEPHIAGYTTAMRNRPEWHEALVCTALHGWIT